VIDRITGRWVMLPVERLPMLRLLATPSAALGDGPLRRSVGALRSLLSERGIGHAPRHAHDRLNTVILKLTKACNLACSYCYDYEQGERARHMDPDTGRRAVREAVELATGTLHFILHGGEPMLAWELVEALVEEAHRAAAGRDLEVRFIGQTNLTRLDSRIVGFSLEHDLQWGISLDGPPSLNDRFRIAHDGSGSYARFMACLERFPEFTRRCGVMTTVTSVTADRLPEIAHHFRELGMPAWDWTLFQPIGRGRDDSCFRYDPDRLCQSWDELFDAVEAGELDGFAVKPVLKYLDNFLDGPVSNMCMRSQCGAARDLLSVSHDGTVEACDCIDPLGARGGLGTLQRDGLAGARASQKADLIRSREVERLRCGECLWQGVCGGTCLAHAGGVDRVWDDACALSLLAFDRISESLARSDRLLRYRESCA
jgi:uncharacterized protein